MRGSTAPSKPGTGDEWVTETDLKLQYRFLLLHSISQQLQQLCRRLLQPLRHPHHWQRWQPLLAQIVRNLHWWHPPHVTCTPLLRFFAVLFGTLVFTVYRRFRALFARCLFWRLGWIGGFSFHSGSGFGLGFCLAVGSRCVLFPAAGCGSVVFTVVFILQVVHGFIQNGVNVVICHIIAAVGGVTWGGVVVGVVVQVTRCTWLGCRSLLSITVQLFFRWPTNMSWSSSPVCCPRMLLCIQILSRVTNWTKPSVSILYKPSLLFFHCSVRTQS